MPFEKWNYCNKHMTDICEIIDFIYEKFSLFDSAIITRQLKKNLYKLFYKIYTSSNFEIFND